MLWVQMSPQRQRRIPEEVEFCAEKHRLEDEFITAIREVVGLLDRQSRALIDGDAEFLHFDLLLHFAHEKKDAAKYALIAHIESHHCEEG
jgi:hypothetical protein